MAWTRCGRRVPARTGSSSPEREAFVAALNGVWGDHLANTGNPLAIAMSLRVGGRPYQATLRAPTRKLLVLVHGLAMNDLQWTRRGHDHGQALARDLGFTPVLPALQQRPPCLSRTGASSPRCSTIWWRAGRCRWMNS